MRRYFKLKIWGCQNVFIETLIWVSKIRSRSKDVSRLNFYQVKYFHDVECIGGHTGSVSFNLIFLTLNKSPLIKKNFPVLLIEKMLSLFCTWNQEQQYVKQACGVYNFVWGAKKKTWLCCSYILMDNENKRIRKKTRKPKKSQINQWVEIIFIKGKRKKYNEHYQTVHSPPLFPIHPNTPPPTPTIYTIYTSLAQNIPPTTPNHPK